MYFFTFPCNICTILSLAFTHISVKVNPYETKVINSSLYIGNYNNYQWFNAIIIYHKMAPYNATAKILPFTIQY
jgi:hypothetical protein